MQMLWLAAILKAEGLTVEEHDGWENRTKKRFDRFKPVGLINHHTSGPGVIPKYPDPPFYPDSALEDKCNLTIRPDGVVVVLNAGIAKDTGLGDRNVLEAVRADRPAPAPLDTYKGKTAAGHPIPGGSNPGIDGTDFFIDIEVQHLGTGGPIVPVQLEALIVTNVAICKKMDWDPRTRVIGHREWTKRKTDPRWNGDSNPMPGIRADTLSHMEDEMTPEQAKQLKEVHSILTGPLLGGPNNPTAEQAWNRTYNLVQLIREELPEDVDATVLAGDLAEMFGPELGTRVGNELVRLSQES
jgi:hypothetical protein